MSPFYSGAEQQGFAMSTRFPWRNQQFSSLVRIKNHFAKLNVGGDVIFSGFTIKNGTVPLLNVQGE